MRSYAIIGAQFGSEGKGALAGYLALKREPDVVVSNWSPNAGHTFRLDKNTKWVRKAIPIGSISPRCQYILIGPGSVIDPETFFNELEEVSYDTTVIIHPHAAVVSNQNTNDEKSLIRIGSTMKGSGAALVNKVWRQPDSLAIHHPSLSKMCNWEKYYEVITGDWDNVQIEGCQGFSLSYHHGFYPYCTGRDTTIHQLLADIGWPRHRKVEVYGCARTYPIRVSNRRGEDGEIYSSGPTYPDSREISFTDLGQKPELTTVTQLPRRIFTYSKQQTEWSARINGFDRIYLSFMDYPDVDGQLPRDELLYHLNEQAPVAWMSNGPEYRHMEEMFTDEAV